MQFSALAALLICATFTNGVAAQSQRPVYIQFNKAVDEIHHILRKTVKPTVKDVTSISVIACNALNLLLDKEPRFKEDIEAMAAAGPKNSEELRQLAENIVFFVDSFVEEEHRYLLQSGISGDSIAEILIAAALVRTALLEPLPAGTVHANLQKLRGEVCRGAKGLTSAEASNDAFSARKRKLRKWALGLGGASLITADFLFAVPSGGTAAASFTLGGATVGAALSQ